MNAAVGRRLLAEYIGAGLLVAVVVGSGIAPVSAPAFIAAQLLGGTIGTILAVALYPARPGPPGTAPMNPPG